MILAAGDREGGGGAGMEATMDRVRVGDVELDYQVRGSGPPVLLIHAGGCADWFAPLLAEPALSGRHRVVSYHRVGYAGSSHPAGPVSLADQAAHARGLLDHLGIGRALVAGHSSGGNIAMRLALDAPERVGALALLEPALLAVPTGPYGPAAFGRYQAGDKAGAMDAWMRGVCGPDYAEVMERAIPGALDQAVADADTFFAQELAAVRDWPIGERDAARITQPALSVLGERSREVTPVFDQRHELLLAWLPDVEPFVLAGATHLLHLQNPAGMAEGLAGFAARHPQAVPSGGQ
jgi:pimeloyl-ACP methyl ester carboxylesterase